MKKRTKRINEKDKGKKVAGVKSPNFGAYGSPDAPDAAERRANVNSTVRSKYATTKAQGTENVKMTEARDDIAGARGRYGVRRDEKKIMRGLRKESADGLKLQKANARNDRRAKLKSKNK